MPRILITGGSGKVAALLRPGWPGRTGRCGCSTCAHRTRSTAPGAEESMVAGVEDLDALSVACKDVDAVVHLGGLAKEDTQDNVLRVNVAGTLNVLEAARRAGVRRVVLASSSHAVGFADVAGRTGVPADLPGRPDTLYGWSKVAGETAGQLYADRFGMDVLCPRIGMWTSVPPSLRGSSCGCHPTTARGCRGVPERAGAGIPAAVGDQPQHPAVGVPGGGRGARL